MRAPTYRFHPDAVAEAEAARDWNAQHSPRAALDFLEELDRAIAAVLDAPERWSESDEGDRRYVLKRFPFLLVYRYVDDAVEFVAVAHGRRRPRYWKHR
jgi:plasmid stabilization system protein ParE